MLVCTPAPMATESLLGYVLRVSETNGYDTPWHVMSYAGFSQEEMQSVGFPLDKLAAVLGRKTRDLEAIAYCIAPENGKRHFKILGNSLGASLKKGQLRLAAPAFCPHCVQQSGFLDAFWDLSLAVACPHHGCRSLNSCTACGKALNWFRPGLLTCKCGAKLEGIALEPASPGMTALMGILKAKLHGASILELPNPAHFPVQALENLSLRSFIGIAAELGGYNLFSEGKPNENRRYLTMESAAAALTDWPSGYHQFLHRLGTGYKNDNPSVIGLRKQFEQFYIAMFKTNSYAADAGFFREEFIRFGLTTWGEAVVDNKLMRGGDTDEESRFLSNSRIACDAGIRPITLRRWAEKGLLPSKAVKIGNQMRYILDADAVTLSKQTPGRILQAREAAARVDLPVSVLQSLKASGHFAVENMPRFKGGFHEADLENFRQKLTRRSSAVGIKTSSDEPVLSLKYILQELQFWSKGGKADFIAAYLDGSISAVGRTGDSWQDVLFRRSDVDAYVRASRRAASDGALSQREAATSIGCDPQAIPALIELGYLVACPGPDRTRVQDKSLQDFSVRYVALAALAKTQDTSPARLLRLCRKFAIETLSIPRKKGPAIPFIQRESQEALLTQALLNPTRAQVAQARIGPVEKLRQYLNGLNETGTPLPRRGRKPNKRGIANACGINRDVLYDHPDAVAMLEEFDTDECLRFDGNPSCKELTCCLVLSGGDRATTVATRQENDARRRQEL